jgi:hypothetical protein
MTEVLGSFLLKPSIALTFPHWEKSLAGKPFLGILTESLRIEIEIFFENSDYRGRHLPRPSTPGGRVLIDRPSRDFFS